jgi:hypothetical protein
LTELDLGRNHAFSGLALEKLKKTNPQLNVIEG